MAKTEMTEVGAGGLSGALAKLTERERSLLGLMAICLTGLALAIGVYLFSSSQKQKQVEIDQYQETLDALQEYGPTYIAQQNAESEGGSDRGRFNSETLKNNRVKLTSFVATHASAVDLKVDNYDEDELPLSTGNKDDGPILTEHSVKVDIKSAEMDKVILLLDRIEKSKEPVIIKRVNLRNLTREKGKVRANVVLSTYSQKDQES